MIEGKKPKTAELPGVPLRTSSEITWCPGCPNFIILESVRRTFLSLMKQGMKKEDFAIATGIGCHGKIYDYLHLSGFYGLHGRPIPVATGIKFGNPNLKVVAFAGDGDTYSEGIAHFVHACRTNPDITLVVHDNQSFSLTTGQSTPTSQVGFVSKAQPQGNVERPLNPIHLAIATGATFVARCNARDIKHTQEILEEAIKHKGFSFVEIIQDCLIFNLDMNYKDNLMYKLPNKNRTYEEAMKIADEFNYNDKKSKIALGVIYQDKTRKALHENFPQLANLEKKKTSWKNLKR